jgi:hypothetical protein
VVPLAPSVVTPLGSAATSTTLAAAARLETPATLAAAHVTPAFPAEVTALTTAATPRALELGLLGTGTARGEEPQRGGSERCTGEL